MPWATNPLFAPGKYNEKVTTDIEARPQHDSGDAPDLTRPTSPKCDEWSSKAPTDHLTRRQAVYIFVLDGVVAAVLGAGINFGIAYGTSTLPTRSTPRRRMLY
jgi:hypothetical protein